MKVGHKNQTIVRQYAAKTLKLNGKQSSVSRSYFLLTKAFPNFFAIPAKHKSECTRYKFVANKYTNKHVYKCKMLKTNKVSK